MVDHLKLPDDPEFEKAKAIGREFIGSAKLWTDMSYQEMAAEYNRHARAWMDAIYQRWITEAVLTAAIALPWDDTVRTIVRYDPQRLLPPPGPHNRPMSLWDAATLRDMLGFGESFWLGTCIDIDGESIDFERIKPMEREVAVFHVDSSGYVASISHYMEAIDYSLTPFVKPLAEKKARQQGFGFIDESHYYKPPPPKSFSKKGKRAPSYLDHDPTKKHHKCRRR